MIVRDLNYVFSSLDYSSQFNPKLKTSSSVPFKTIIPLNIPLKPLGLILDLASIAAPAFPFGLAVISFTAVAMIVNF